jgi:hypothetical protein
MEIKKYSEKGLETVKSCNFLEDKDWKALKSMHNELQDTFEKKQIWRTETEMRVSVLNDIKFPTKASKYWQCVREQSVFFENLITLSFEYKRNNIEIKKLERNIKKESDELEKESLKVDLEECLFKKKNMELAARDRMREIKLWSKIKKELDDGSFDTKDVNNHQLVSYTQRYLLECVAASQSGASMSSSEARNLLGQTQTMIKECEKRGILEQVLPILSLEQQNKIMPQLGYKKNI